mmetsp:Transcript_17262/g.50153  ORF Transcript_17262/g.50153 Transcript_17262/m.50153 type:complete len:262 (-) Transcript_17262:361-1146(-)
MRRTDVIRDSSHGEGFSSTLHVLPLAQESDEDVGRSAVVQETGDKVQVGHQRGLKNNGHVGGVEQFDGVGALLSAVFLILDGKIDPPSLEVDDHDEYQHRRHEVGQVGKILAVQRLLESADLVSAGDEQMEECDDGALELSPPSRVECGGTERLPHNVLANVGRNEERNARSQSVPLLEELVEGQHDQTGEEELGDDQQGVSGPDGGEVAVHSGDDVRNGLSNSDENSKELLRALEEGPILLDVVIHLNDSRSREQLHDKT